MKWINFEFSSVIPAGRSAVVVLNFPLKKDNVKLRTLFFSFLFSSLYLSHYKF